MDKLRSLGIGVKGPIQQFHENDPYGRYIAPGGGAVRGEPMTPEILEARRRYMARQKPTYRDTGNVVRVETIEDVSPTRATAEGMGGYSQGGLFQYTPTEIPEYLKRPEIPEYLRRREDVAPPSNGSITDNVYGMSGMLRDLFTPSNYVPPESVTRGLPPESQNPVIDVTNAYLAGDMPKWRTQDAPSFSFGQTRFGEPITSEEQKQADIENNLEILRLRNRYPEKSVPVEELARLEEERAIERQEIAAELVRSGTVDRTQIGHPFTKKLVDDELFRREAERTRQRQEALSLFTPQLQELDTSEQQRMMNRSLRGQQQAEALQAVDQNLIDYDATEQQRMLNRAELNQPPAPIQQVNYDSMGNIIPVPESQIPTPIELTRPEIVEDTAAPMTKVFTAKELRDTPGVLFTGDNAVAEVERRLGRKLSAGEAQLVRDEGFTTVQYKDAGGVAIGVGQQGKYNTPNSLTKGFEAAVADKTADMKRIFGKAYPKDEKAQAALVNLAYRGDVQPKWSALYRLGKKAEAEKEFWNNKSYQKLLEEEKKGKSSQVLNRLRRNARDLFGFSSK